jgi:hypothetical protein
MTNIFARKPLKTSQAVAKRYEPWITVFEKIVTEAQEDIKAIAQMEVLYNPVKEFMLLQNLPNESRIKVDKGIITVRIKTLPTNYKRDIEDFFQKFGEFLIRNNLRETEGLPSIQWGSSWSYDVNCRYHVKGNRWISIYWDIPMVGIADLEVEIIRKDVVIQETEYKLVPRKLQLEG